MTKTKTLDDLTDALTSLARDGAYEALAGGLALEFGNGHSLVISLSEIQEAADSFPDETMQMRMKLRIGLAPYITYSQRQRNEMFAASVGTKKWASVPRSEQDRPTRILAGHILTAASRPKDVPTAFTPYNAWEVLDYKVQNLLPDGGVGDAVQTHYRHIRSKVDGLTQFRITQNANWASGQMPSYRLLTAGECKVENVRETREGDEPGYRFDFVVDIDPLALGEDLEIQWIRTYPFALGDLGKPGTDASMVIAPILSVRHAVISIKFPKTLTPSEVWEIVNVPSQDRTVPPSERKPIELKSGVATREFFDVPVGYASGIGWKWETLPTAL